MQCANPGWFTARLVMHLKGGGRAMLCPQRTQPHSSDFQCLASCSDLVRISGSDLALNKKSTALAPASGALPAQTDRASHAHLQVVWQLPSLKNWAAQLVVLQVQALHSGCVGILGGKSKCMCFHPHSGMHGGGGDAGMCHSTPKQPRSLCPACVSQEQDSLKCKL